MGTTENLINNPLHPQLHIPGGGMVFIIPGTGPVVGATREQARETLRVFIADLKLPGIIFRSRSKLDYGHGRFAFKLYLNGRSCEIQMPGRPVEQVRYLKSEGQNIFDFPRLYVDDSSWVWLYALSNAQAALTGEEDTDD